MNYVNFNYSYTNHIQNFLNTSKLVVFAGIIIFICIYLIWFFSRARKVYSIRETLVMLLKILSYYVTAIAFVYCYSVLIIHFGPIPKYLFSSTIVPTIYELLVAIPMMLGLMIPPIVILNSFKEKKSNIVDKVKVREKDMKGINQNGNQ